MQTNIDIEDAIHLKTRELCETILEQPQFRQIRGRIDTFMGDASAQRLYEAVNEKGRSLHHKQHQGEQLTESEIAAFDKLRDSLLANPVARGFIDAQQEMQQIQEEVSAYVGKTFELGRVPKAEELESGGGGCCGGESGGGGGGGGGCGCHH